MKKFGYVVAAIVALGLAAPSIASAENLEINGGDQFRGARAEFRDHRDHRDHGWRGHHGDRMVVVRHRRHHDHHD